MYILGTVVACVVGFTLWKPENRILSVDECAAFNQKYSNSSTTSNGTIDNSTSSNEEDSDTGTSSNEEDIDRVSKAYLTFFAFQRID